MKYDFERVLAFKTNADLESFLSVSKNRPKPLDFYHAFAKISELPLYKNSEGKISISTSVKYWDVKDPYLSGVIKIFKHPSRSKVMKGSATESENLRISAITPLFMSAFKEYKDVPYSAWDWSDKGIPWVVDAQILSLLPYILDPSQIPEFPLEEKLAILESITTDPISTWSPTSKEISKYPRLMRVIMLQTWVAYPTLRDKFMILDLEDLDNIPDSIYGDIDVFTDSPFSNYEPMTTKSEDSPW